MTSTTLKMTSLTIAASAVAWVGLLLGLVLARFFVTEPPPNVVLTFSDKGLTRLFAELISLGIGGLGLAIALVLTFVRAARSRLLALAVVSNVGVCAACIALLL
jgi:hypothetical protein